MKRTVSIVLSIIAMCIGSLLVVALALDHSKWAGCEVDCIGSNAFWGSFVIVPAAGVFALSGLVTGMMELGDSERPAARDIWFALLAFMLIAVLGWLSWNDPF